MNEQVRFWMSVVVRLVVAMVIPLRYSYSQGFLDVQTTAYGMTWVYADGLAMSGWSVLAALVVSFPVVAYAVFMRGKSSSSYLDRLGANSVVILIFLPLLGFALSTTQNVSWQESPVLVPPGFCVLLLLLFVILPATWHLADSEQLSQITQFSLLATVMLAVCVLSPLAVENYYAVLGVDEQSIYGCLFRLTSGRWGLTSEIVLDLTDSKQWSLALLTYQIAVTVLVARLLFACLFMVYLTDRVPLAAVVIGAAAQESFVLSTVLASGARAISDQFIIWTVLPVPVVLPASLLLIFVKLKLKARGEGAEDDGNEYVSIPLAVRIRSLFMRKRRE